MNRIFLYLAVVTILFYSCKKTQQATSFTYSVTNDANATTFNDIYIPSTGTYQTTVLVKFLQGYQDDNDSVRLIFTGLPANVKVTPDTFTGLATYTEVFTFTSDSATEGVYPVTLNTTNYYNLPIPINFNLHVTPPDCAALFWGTLIGSSACTARGYTHTATGSSGGTDILNINNFGGYGTSCNVPVTFNCGMNTVSIPSGNYGNGVTLQGSGTYTSTELIINYTASSTPTGIGESCTLTYTLQ